jgi:hypothetical protein
LAHELIASLDAFPAAEVEELWRAEAERRQKEIQSGKVTPIPGDEVLRELDALG